MNTPLRLSATQALHFTLTRQHLVQPASDPLQVLRSLVAIQSQYPGSVPIALWARVANLPPGWAEQALTESRQVIKAWSLRWTLHTLLPEDLALLTQSANRGHLVSYERFLVNKGGLSPEQIEINNACVLQALAGGALTRSELHRVVEKMGGKLLRGWGHDVMDLNFRGEVLIVSHGGREYRFARRDLWLPELTWHLLSEDEAHSELLRRYLSAYGPATQKDFRYWSGLKVGQVQSSFDSCMAELIPVEVDGWSGTYYALAGDEAALREAGTDLPAVRLLPRFEVLMLAYENSLRFMEEGQRKLVSRPAGQIEATILLDGKVSATWRMELKRNILVVKLAPFRQLREQEERGIRYEFERLAQFLGAVKMEYHSS